MGKSKSFSCLVLVLTCLLVLSSGIVFANKIQIKMTCMNSPWYKGGLESAIEAFEKENPNISINVEYYPYEEILSVTEVKLGAKSSEPDIIFADGPLVSAYTVKGYLQPLDNYFKNKEIKNWVSAARKAVIVDNKLMAAPLTNSSMVLYYNKNLFKKYGIEPLSKDPNERLTWEELVDIAKKLTIDTNNDGVIDVWGFSFNQVSKTYQLLPLPQSLGAEVIAGNGLKTRGIINSEEWIKAFQFYQDLFNKYNVSPKGVDVSQIGNYFSSGRLAMMLGGDFYANIYSINGFDEWDYAPHPYFKGGEVATPTGGWCLGMNKYSKHRAEAFKFIQYLTTTPGNIKWFKNDGHISPNKDTLEYIMNEPKYNEWPMDIYNLVIYETKNTANPRPVTPGYLEYEQILNTAFEDIRNGYGVEDVLSNAAKKIDRLMIKYSE